MKKFALVAALLFGVAISTFAQEGYQFTDKKVIGKTVPITNQYRSCTCWCFSTLSFLEEEVLAAGGEQMTLSQMWVVRHAYFDKAIKYVRLHGNLNFAVGGAAHDVTEMIKKYGIVPLEVYSGYNYGTEMPEFGEIDNVLKGYVDAIIRNGNGRLTTAWIDGLNAILDTYFGVRPEKFTYKGKEYTPKSFAESLPIKMEDYIEFSSYTHHPFYSQFAIEVPDNWRWDLSYNLPLEDMMAIFDYAIENGYTVAWASDVSEAGFNRQGLGIVPDVEGNRQEAGSDEARWIGKSPEEQNAILNNTNAPGKELKITQELRQEGYDNRSTTDDHGMHIYGIAKDQNGGKYYMVKNSWGETGKYKGFWYVSEAFVQYKTMNIVVNKNAIPAPIRKKMGL